MNRTANWIPVIGVLLFIAGAAVAEAPRIYALTDVRIVTAPGEVIENGTLVMRDGLIESVGPNVEVPADAWTFAGEDDWTVYPAFIDAAATVGLEAETASGPPGRPRGGETDPTGAPHPIESVHPQLAVIDEFDVGHASIERHRQLGFAIAHVLPGKGVFRGQSAVVLLRDAPVPELVVADRLAQVVALETSSFMARQYPSSLIGAVAAVRQVLLDAQRQQVWSERYAANPVGMQRPEFRASDAALQAVLRDEHPVVFVSLNELDPDRFRQFAASFGLRGMTVATGLGQRPDDLLSADMPLLIPLELPEKPDLSDADEQLAASMRDLQRLVRAPSLPAVLAGSGAEFALVTAGMKSTRDFHENLAAVVEAGLSAEQALAALTTTPARLLQLERTAGTIEPGKQANVLVVEGELFTAKPAFRHVFVDGYHEEIEAEETIGDPNAVVDPRGTWEIITEVMGRTGESTWTISGSPDAYRGYSESSQGGRQAFRSVELRGNALTVVSDTPRGEFEITVVVTGESLAGDTTMESPRGSARMDIEGRRVSGPENEQR